MAVAANVLPVADLNNPLSTQHIAAPAVLGDGTVSVSFVARGVAVTPNGSIPHEDNGLTRRSGVRCWACGSP